LNRVLINKAREDLEVKDEHEQISAIGKVFENEGLYAFVQKFR
jgi:hypothetical protein